MAQSGGHQEIGASGAADMDSLLGETTARKIWSNGEGSLRASLNGDYCSNIGLNEGSDVQLLLNNGAVPVVIDEECIIIRPHPKSSEDER